MVVCYINVAHNIFLLVFGFDIFLVLISHTFAVSFCFHIVNSLTFSDEFSENEKEREIAIIENQKKRYANKEFYNNNNLREVIPVLETADKELKKDNRDSIHKDAKSAIKKLKKHLKVIDAKREDFLSALENIVNDDENKKSYILYKDEASRNIVLYNYLNEAANLVATEKGTIGDSIVKPAVITIDLDTNYVSEYKTVNEMFEKDDKYASCTPTKEGLYIYNADAFRNDISQSGTEFMRDTSSKEGYKKALELIDAEFDTEAELIQNQVIRNKKQLNFDLLTEVENTAELYDNVRYDEKSNKVTIYSENGKSQIDLYYSVNGLSSAYFKSEKDELTKVYDYRDEENGFSNIRSSAYHQLLKNDAFESFLNIDGNYIDLDSLKTYEANLAFIDETFKGANKYDEKQVGKTEIVNSTYNYKLFYSESLEQKMLQRAEEYRNAVADDVTVTYNPYNNTINLSNEGKVLSITFDELGSRMDIFFKKEGAKVTTKNSVIEDHRLRNKAVLEDDVFKHITENLGVSIQDIARGQAGKILSDAEIQAKKDTEGRKVKKSIER